MQANTTHQKSREAGQFLTFVLGDEHYGVEILQVQEIRGFTPVTPLPNSPAYVRGVINLRGTIVPVVDLRLKLGLPERAYDRFTVVVVTTVGTKIVGLIVDAVSDVMTFEDKSIQPAPTLGDGQQAPLAQGIARLDDRLVVLLDLVRVLDGGSFGLEGEPAHAAAVGTSS